MPAAPGMLCRRPSGLNVRSPTNHNHFRAIGRLHRPCVSVVKAQRQEQQGSAGAAPQPLSGRQQPSQEQQQQQQSSQRERVGQALVPNSTADSTDQQQQVQEGDNSRLPPSVLASSDAAPQQQQQQQQQRSATKAFPPPPPPAAAASNWLLDPLNNEIMSIALPMLATLAADPIAGLVDTAYMGRLGATQLAGVGVALSVFNTTTKLFNVPLLSVTTSSVAAAAGREAVAARRATAAAAAAAKAADGDDGNGTASSSSSSSSGQPPAAATTIVSSAVASSTLIAAGVGTVQALILLCSSTWAARLWGVSASSPLWEAASQFLSIRALGAPVTVLLLVMQGVYRGLSDTRTPFYATLAANGLNVVLGYGLIFGAGLGIRGAAVATVIAQLLPLAWLFYKLQHKYGVTFTDASTLRSVGKLFAPTGYLVLRTAAITFTYAIATGLTARAGPTAAACHQVCFQVWLASSLMADSLAVACQTMLAKSLAIKDTTSARQVVDRCVSMAGLLGCGLAAALALGRGSIPGMFSSDPDVLELVAALLPFVIVSQPINALAFVWDGVLFGAGGFRFASVQMALCAMPAVLLMNLGPHNNSPAAAAAVLPKLQWVWAGLTLVMALRAASIWLPYSLALPPFTPLAGQQGQQGQQLQQEK